MLAGDFFFMHEVTCECQFPIDIRNPTQLESNLSKRIINDNIEIKEQRGMAFGIALAIAAITGIIYGTISRNKPLGIASAIALIMIIAVWVYFYNNPY